MTVSTAKRRSLLFALLVVVAALLLAGCTEAPPEAGGTSAPVAAEYADGGINEGASRFPTGPQSGLWAGNVETIPDRPPALPDSFYEEPEDEPMPYPDQVPQMRPGYSVSFKEPAEAGRPLWVFADALDKPELDRVVEEAANQGRVVVVYGRHYRDLVGFVAPPQPGDPWMAEFGLILSWAPWNERVPDAVSPYWFTPPESPVPTREAIYMAMAFETLIVLRPMDAD